MPETRAGVRRGSRHSIPIFDRSSPAKLSFAQQQLWFLDRLYPGSSAYNFDVTLRLRGELWKDELHRAVQCIVARHEGLRTVFFTLPDGTPRQRVNEDMEIPLDFVDLTSLPAEIRHSTAHSMLTEWARIPFDLEQGPLLRVRLVRVDPLEHLLCLSFHHAVCDGWSVELLYRELEHHYSPTGATAPLPEPAVQYADYADWQRRRLSGAYLERQLAWWRGHLDGVPTSLALPERDGTVDPAAAHGDQVVSALRSATVDAVAELARATSATPFTVLLSAYALLLARHTGMRSLLIGTQVAGRPRPELHDLIGLFVNTLPIRVELDQARTFTELIAHVRESAWDTFTHDQVPLETIVEAVRPRRVVGRTPLVQAVFAAPATPLAPPALPGLTAEPLTLAPTTSKFDLGMAVAPGTDGGEHTLSLTYNTQLLDDESAQQLVGRYRELLAAVLKDPDADLATALPDRPARPGTTTRPAPAEAAPAREEAPAEAAPEEASAEARAPFRSDLERLLTDLWREVLHNEHITVHDNFFDVGGQSLALARIHARLERRLDRELPMVAFYEHPTIAALVAHLSGDSDQASTDPAPDTASDLRTARLRAERARSLQRRRAAT